jgi:xanthosine utilization system XapX-like protein
MTFTKIYLVASTVTVVILFCLLLFLRDIPSEALVAFLGVMVGSIITSFVQYLMSEANMRQQLRLAALDMRLQTAQEAYSLWRQLRRLPRAEGEPNAELVDRTIRDCQQWWETHSLYLTAEARNAFKDAYIAASNLAEARLRGAGWGEMKESTDVIERAGRKIEESVYLPSIGELDSKRII